MATIKKEVSCKVENDSSSPAKESICQVCRISFSNEAFLNHVCVQVKKEMINCKVCQMCFTADEMTPDQQAGAEEYLCETCLMNENNFTDHDDEIDTGDQSFTCEVCGKQFIKEISLKSHYKCHKRDHLYRCDSCPKVYLQQEALEKHYLMHTILKPFKCEFCEKAFKCNSSLKSHYSSHIKGKQFFCKWCNKGFKLKSSLQNHLISHAANIPQDNIAKSDFNKDDEEKGVLPPLPDKLFKCKECSKCFGSKLFLESHIQSHADKNSFMCNICKKTFKQSIGLKVHYRYHTREKPYKCYYCDKRFYDTSDRKSHILLHHNNIKPVI